MRALIDAGCDLNAKSDQAEETALQYASANGRAATVKLLLGAGCDKAEAGPGMPQDATS